MSLSPKKRQKRYGFEKQSWKNRYVIMKYRTIINSETKEALCTTRIANLLRCLKNGKRDIYLARCDIFRVFNQVYDSPAGLKC